jgi:hypothetical protein
MTNLKGLHDPAERAREKQEARDRDEAALARGEIVKNGFFDALDPSRAKIIRSR